MVPTAARHAGKATEWRGIEVVREALRLLEDRDELRRLRLSELRSQVAAGLDSLDRGQARNGDAVIDEILDDVPASDRG